MSSESPDVVLYSSDGYELATVNGSPTPNGTRGLMMSGSDGTNSKFILIDGSARQVVVGSGTAGTPTGGVVTVQGVSGGTPQPIIGNVNNIDSSNNTIVVGTTAAGSSALGNPVIYAGVDNSGLVRTVRTSTSGYLLTEITDGTNIMPTADAASRAQFHKLTDGVNTAAVKAASTSAVATDPALVTSLSPNSSLPSGSNVIGAVTQSGGPWSISGSGNFTVVQATASNLNAAIVGTGTAGSPASGIVTIQGNASGTPVPVSGTLTASNPSISTTGSAPPSSATYIAGSVTTSSPSYVTGQMSALSLTTAGALRVDGSSVTQPVSGSVSVNQSIATSLNATVVQGTPNTISNSWPVKISDGTNTATVKASSTAAASTDTSVVTAFSPNSSLPVGSNIIGLVKITDGTNIPAVKTTFAAAVPGDGSLVVALSPNSPVPAGTNTIGAVNQGTANTISNSWPVKISDGTNTAAVKAASTESVATDSSLVVSLSPNTEFSVLDRSLVTPGTQIGFPIIGQSNGNTGRIIKVGRLGHVVPGYQNLLAADTIEGTSLNTWLWSTSQLSMTAAVSSGILTLNNNSNLNASAYVILLSNKQFPILNQSTIGTSFKAQIVNNANATAEIGFGAPTSTTAIVSNGAFFRINSSGAVYAVISYNGTETVSAQLGTLSSSNYYLFIVYIGDNDARFIIESSSGTPLVDYNLALPTTVAGVAYPVSHINSFARIYNSATAPTAATQIKIASFQAWQYDINVGKPWSEQLGGIGRISNINPTTFAQTLQSAAATNPTTSTPTNTACVWSTLGGEFSLNMTAASANYLGIFGYAIPSPYTLNITEIFIPNPTITTGFSSTAAAIQFTLMVGNSNNPSTATGFRYPLGSFGAASSAAAGTALTGLPINLCFKTPITVLPGQYVMLMIKVVSGTATGTYFGSSFINGYYE